MRYYDKPLREIIAFEALAKLPDTFSTSDMIGWVRDNYPRFSENTVRMQLIAMSANDLNVRHYPMPPGTAARNKLLKLGPNLYRRYDPDNDPPPISSDGEGTDEPPRVSVGDKQIRRNPFEVLGIAPDAEAEVIAAAYRTLARKYHPDVNRSLPPEKALARMSELNWARDELEGDLTGWRNRVHDFQRSKTPANAESPPPEDALRSEEFDVHTTLAEWMAGGGERILSRLVQEGGTRNFAIAAAGDYYVQFLAARGGTGFYLEAVSNKYLPRAKRLSTDRIRALQALQFSTDAQGGNFVLEGVPNALSAAQIAATVLRHIYGVRLDSSLSVHVCFE